MVRKLIYDLVVSTQIKGVLIERIISTETKRKVFVRIRRHFYEVSTIR